MPENDPTTTDTNALEIKSVLEDIVKAGIADGGEQALKDSFFLMKMVFVILGLALLAGIGGWIAMVFAGKTIPGELGVIIGTISGGLVGVIASPTTPSGSGSGK